MIILCKRSFAKLRRVVTLCKIRPTVDICGMTSLVAEVPRDEIIATVCMHAASGSGLSQNKASGIFLQQYKSDTQKSALVAGSPGLTLSQGKAWDISVSSTGVPVLLKRSASSVSTAQVKAQEKSYMEHSSRSS